MKLMLEKSKEGEGRKYEHYTIGRYEIDLTTYASGNRYINTRIKRTDDRYIPEIYCRDDFEGHVLGFKIQTTSYGALSPEEIHKVIAGYNEALEVAEILTKEFVSK